MIQEINENSLNDLFELFCKERLKLLLDMKNEKELKASITIQIKLLAVERITKEILKYRNTLVKHKAKDF
jgi:transcriptional antiterminator Rof (Rho-off)